MPEIPNGSSLQIKTEDGTKYVLSRRGALYSCTCPEWKRQQIPGMRRTCTHLRQYRGAEEEEKRIEEREKRRQESVLSLQKKPSITPQLRREPDSTDLPTELPHEYQVRQEQVDGEETDYDQELSTSDCMWSVIVKYDRDINKALQEARQEEFKNSVWSKYASIDDAIKSGDEKGTGTILDISEVGEKPGPLITSPLSEDAAIAMFGTSKPTRQMIGKETLSKISEMLFEKWDFADRMSVFQSFYIVLYTERSMDGKTLLVPSEILFGGWSDWG